MHGKFGWYELVSEDVAKAAEFYGAVVGWTTEKQGESYTVFKTGPFGVAGHYPLTAEMKAKGALPGWLGYVVCDDVDATATEIAAKGGRVLKGPEDVPGMLRFAVATDPQGIPFVIFTPNPRMGDPPSPEPGMAGTVGWHELLSPDWKAAWEFYSALFGWKKGFGLEMGPMGTYQTFGTVEGPEIGDIGGMMDKPAGIPGPPGWWAYYITVDGAAAALERVKAAGGTITQDVQEVPGGSWIAQGVDLEGAHFSLVSRRP